jgi:hypothetical protein
MLRFLEAGLVAGTRQLVAVILITSAFFLWAGEKIAFAPGELVGQPELLPSASSLLAWAYLLTAIGLACTQDRTLILTSERIRHATRLLGGGRRSRALASQLIIAAVVFAFLSLRPPPSLLIDVCRYAGYVPAAPTVWAGMMTMAVAFFGASAHAAIRSA